MEHLPIDTEYRSNRVERIVADLLCSAFLHDHRGRGLPVWEREGLRWLAERWDADPTISFNAMTAERVREWRRGGPIKTGLGGTYTEIPLLNAEQIVREQPPKA